MEPSSQKYSWEQTHDFVTISTEVDASATKRNIKFESDPEKIKIAYLGTDSNFICMGELEDRVYPGTWSFITNGKTKILSVELEKVDKKKWWDRLFKTDLPIRTAPPPRFLRDLPQEERQEAEKIILEELKRPSLDK